MKNLLLTWLFLSLAICLQAQYTLTGRVIDGNTKEPLLGTAIGIENTALGTTSNADGYFRLEGLKDKEVVVLVNFMGYKSQRIVHRMDTQKELRIELVAEEFQLDEVVVSGIAEGQIKAIIEMKQAENIKNIVSAEQILTFPDLNAAEVMQRIPGITLQRDQGDGRFVQLRGHPP